MNNSTLLRVDKLVKKFAGLVVTDEACLEVRAGEFHALIGPNGAGKTTLIHQLSGTLAPSSGKIYFEGNDVTQLAIHERVSRGLVRSFQITSVFHRLSVIDNIALALQPSSKGGIGFWTRARSDSRRYEDAEAIATRIGLAEKIGRLAGELSHGEQRQLELALALAPSPQLLLLDEPMAGMGVEESQRMVEILQSLRGSVTILLVEHDMGAVFSLADRISTLVFGKIIATGTPLEIRSNIEVRKAYLGDELETTEVLS